MSGSAGSYQVEVRRQSSDSIDRGFQIVGLTESLVPGCGYSAFDPGSISSTSTVASVLNLLT